MYHPYFRGKQYELLTVRECADSMQKAGFVPIIEPVKESLAGLTRALGAVARAGGEAVLIVNPRHGDHSDDSANLVSALGVQLADMPSLSVGILLTEHIMVDDIVARCDEHKSHPITLIHAGFSDAQALKDRVAPGTVHRHVFIDGASGKLYRRTFRDAPRVLLRDGFKRRRNADYSPVEFFSELHATFLDEGVTGFGDFLIVGDEYLESGGPAYAVAIHLTFIDGERDDQMRVFHFVSDTTDTPQDPAGKFAEALAKLVREVNRNGTQVLRTEAVDEFLRLHERGHFPGLGSVKKLSMMHHIQTLVAYFQR